MREDYLRADDDSMTNAEKEIERALRPLSFDDFAGQDKVVENLKIFVEAAKRRTEPLDHVLQLACILTRIYGKALIILCIVIHESIPGILGHEVPIILPEGIPLSALKSLHDEDIVSIATENGDNALRILSGDEGHQLIMPASHKELPQLLIILESLI